MATRIKICGITRPEDALHAAALGADAIGLVFYASSPRAVSVAQARAIVDALPPFVTTVGLFVDATAEEVRGVLEQVPLDLLQFHGDEAPDYCAGFARPYIKAIRMREGVDLVQETERFASARGLLLDAYRPGVPGGTGEVFAWERVPAGLAKPIVVAGGLDAGNVADAIRQVQPDAVDVSGGGEAAKGMKDAAKMTAFVAAVRQADQR